jgi:glycosyltransferase involved in cell wall biosynthesis
MLEGLRRPHVLPALSVVVPNLNGAQFLPETLRSISAQGSARIETIIVDGGSTDGSVELIVSWAAEHNARWISEPDRGQADAINKGLRMATGEVITWLNADDLWQPGAVVRVLQEFCSEPELELLWGFCLVIDAGGGPRYVQNAFVRSDLTDLRRHRNFVPQPASFFRRSLLERFGFLDESYDYMFDYELFLRFSGHVTARFLPEVLASFRIHNASKTSRAYRSFLCEEWRAFRAHQGRLLSPFTLDMLRSGLLAPLLDIVKAPARWLLWRAWGLPAGARLRP